MNKKAYTIILLVIGIIFLLVYIFSYPRTSSIDSLLYGFDNTNNNLNLVHVRQYAETGSFKIPLPYKDQLPRDIQLALTPRDDAQFDGFIVPKFSLGALLLWGTMATVNEESLFVITPLMTVLIVFALYLITRRVFDEKIALITSVIAFIFPTIWIWGSELLHNQFPATFFLLLGIFYFVRLSENKKGKYYFLSALFLASSITCRYEMVLLILPLLFYVIFKKMSIKESLIIIVTLAFSLLPILLLNKELYGDFLVTGYQAESYMVAESTHLPGISYFFTLKPEFISKYVFMYIFRFVPLLVLGAILSLFTIYKDKGKKKYITLYILYVVVVSSIYYGGDVTDGFYLYKVNSAFSYHLMNGYLLMIPLLVVTIFKVKELNKPLGISLFSIFFVITFITTFAGIYGIIDRNNTVEQHYAFSDEIIKKTEPNSVIIVRFSGKFLFPHRNTLYAPVLAPPDPSSIINVEEFRLPEIEPDFYLLGEKAAYIANQGIPVYVTELKNQDDLKNFEQALSKDGYGVQALRMKVDNIQQTKVYKLVKI